MISQLHKKYDPNTMLQGGPVRVNQLRGPLSYVFPQSKDRQRR